MKSRKLPEASIGRICREAIGHASSVEAHAQFIAKANEWVNDYIQGIDYTRVNRGGSGGTGPEMAAISGKADDIGNSLTVFAADLELFGRLGRKLDKLREKIEADWSDDLKREAAKFIAKRATEAAGGGDCENCHRVVSGSRIDRLREGRCGACAKYRQRNPGKERPRHLWGGDSLDDTCQNVLTRAGVDHPCSLEWGHDGQCTFASSEVA